MSRTVNESIKNKPENSGKSVAGKGAGAGAKKASSGAEPAVKAGKAGTRAKKTVPRKKPEQPEKRPAAQQRLLQRKKTPFPPGKQNLPGKGLLPGLK